MEKNYYTHCTTKKHAKFFFQMKKPHKIFFHKKSTQNFTCTWAEHSTIISFGCWNITLLLLLLLQKKFKYYRTCCDYLVVAVCQDGSAWNERKKATFLSAGRKYGLRFVKKLCMHVQVLGVVAMGKDERQGCNASYCWQQPLLFSVEL